jgi:hypothetical protein
VAEDKVMDRTTPVTSSLVFKNRFIRTSLYEIKMSVSWSSTVKIDKIELLITILLYMIT